MRSYIRGLLKNDAQLIALGLSTVTSGDVDTVSDDKFFINLKWGAILPGIRKSQVRRHVLTVWVHDAPNDYTRIQAVLKRVKAIFAGVEAQAWTEGEDPSQSGWITLIEYDGESPDLSDDGHGTIVKQGNYTIIGY